MIGQYRAESAAMLRGRPPPGPPPPVMRGLGWPPDQPARKCGYPVAYSAREPIPMTEGNHMTVLHAPPRPRPGR